VIPKGFILAFRNGFAPVKIFYAIPSPLSSAAVELRAPTPYFCHLASVPMITQLFNPLKSRAQYILADNMGMIPYCFPRRTDHMAKSSMVASTIPNSPILHGNRDASFATRT
jgi:hypothetical protein